MTNTLYRWLLFMKKPSNKIWFVPAYWAIFAAIFAFISRFLGQILNYGVFPDISRDTLEGLLTVIASSMLSVSIFSLSIMVSAFSSVSSGATPRATELIMGDDRTRTAISSFISAFIFAVIAKTALGMEYYGQNGRFLLFIGTIAVLCYLIITLIRWVFTLSHLGGLANTLNKIKQKTEQALENHYKQPYFGATWQGSLKPTMQVLYAEKSGYLTHINMLSLQHLAEENNTHIHVAVRPGKLLFPNTPIAYINDPQQDANAFRSCFFIAVQRDYEQDPEWGFIVLREIAQRALPPTTNDPDTAISVMVTMLNLLTKVPPTKDTETNYDRLSIIKADKYDWISQSFLPIARDGSELVEIGFVMQKILAGISQNTTDPEIADAAQRVAKISLSRFQQQLAFKDDIEAVEQEYHQHFE
ncbi:putative membrane protein [Nicoletella semolina]|uniref:Putative membrane protein n=1 Tax=Nicoletella semolina TaxID=271160 RepID=A0A4R2NCG1_9PAST|nr:DUF2254 family protein [Nicoletella semolina]MDH2924275.1 hypothetical protein [Nicoletella semolina]TCP18827.1 putative membrane protein [Nicoletella semolina]